jgi:integrase
MRKSLSDKGVSALKPRAQRYAEPDPELRGLWIRVQPSGVKSFVTVARDPDGKQVWTSIGPTDSTSIEDARRQARGILERVRSGRPAFEPKSETFGTVVETWRKRHVEANGLRSAREINRLLDTHVLPIWKDREFTSIRRSDVVALLDHIEDNHRSRQTDAVLTITRAIMNWYATRHDDYSPPIVKGMKRHPTASRSRILDDDELRAIWQIAESQGGAFSAIVRMCLLTAQRSRKIATMAWSDIVDGVWTVPHEPREKDVGGALKLPGMALAIIQAQPRMASNPHVFPGRRSGSFRGFASGKRHIDDKLPSDMQRWTIHDLRRSARSLMSRAGVLSEHSEKVMGHVVGGVEGIYDRHHYLNEKADALKRLAALINAIVCPRPADVLPMVRRRGARK